MNDFEIVLRLPSVIKIGRKRYKINTQSIYRGVHFQVRRKIVSKLKELIKKQILEQYDFNVEFKYPIYLYYKIEHNKKVIDIDNISYIYIKIINDSITDLGIIKDDNCNYIDTYKVKLDRNSSLNNDEVIITVYTK